MPDRQIQELIDQQAIRDLLATYCERLDEYDMAGMAATFTEDVATDYGPGRGGLVIGKDAVRKRIAEGQASFRRTGHMLHQSLVEIDGDEAEAITYVTAWHEWLDGRQEALRLRYIDRMSRDADGRWRIAHRRVEAMGVEGFEGTEWTWVHRDTDGA